MYFFFVNLFYNRMSCNCGEDATADSIMKAFKEALCSDKRRSLPSLLPTDLHCVTAAFLRSTKAFREQKQD